MGKRQKAGYHGVYGVLFLFLSLVCFHPMGVICAFFSLLTFARVSMHRERSIVDTIDESWASDRSIVLCQGRSRTKEILLVSIMKTVDKNSR